MSSTSAPGAKKLASGLPRGFVLCLLHKPVPHHRIGHLIVTLKANVDDFSLISSEPLRVGPLGVARVGDVLWIQGGVLPANRALPPAVGLVPLSCHAPRCVELAFKMVTNLKSRVVARDSAENPRRCGEDLLTAILGVLLKVLDEHLSQQVCHIVEPLLFMPCFTGLEDLVRDSLAGGRDLEPKAFVLHDQDIVQVSVNILNADEIVT